MRFLPKNNYFFDYFEKLADLSTQVAQILHNSDINNPAKLLSQARLARKIEHQADSICHTIFQKADSTFITPIDREDIQALAKNLDNIIDLIENACSNLYLYHASEITSEFTQMTRLILESSHQVHALISHLKPNRKAIQEMKKIIINIHSLENKGDRLLGRSFQKLFSGGYSAVDIIKWKDLYENLEEVLDQCEDTADTVETIIAKNF